MNEAEASVLTALRPSTNAVRDLLHSATPVAIATICQADTGWGERETRDFLALLAAEDRLDGPLDSQVCENLELTAWIGGDSTPDRDASLEQDLVTARSLACAIMVRASGEPQNQQLDFFGIESRIVQLISSSLVCSVPPLEPTEQLLAWRLTQPPPLDPAVRSAIWFAILIMLVQSRAGDGLAIALRVAQATHDSLLLGNRSDADRFVIDNQQLVDRWRYWCNRSLARVRTLGEPRLLALFTEILRLTRQAA